MIAPLDLIHRLREIYPDRYEEASGGCFKFHCLLKAIYPQCVGWYNSDHVISEIDGEYYDIDGAAKRTPDFDPLKDFAPRAWDFTKRSHEVFC